LQFQDIMMIIVNLPLNILGSMTFRVGKKETGLYCRWFKG